MSAQLPLTPLHTAPRRLNSRLIELAALTLILLFAASWRIHHIDGPSLWIDEGFTYYTFKADLFDAIKSDRHPPLYFYSLHAWETLTGDSILALRYWSFLPSLMSIAVIYQIGRELARSRPASPRTGLWSIPVLAAGLMALADGENYLAQELRMYTWQVLFCALSLWLYLHWLRKPTRLHAALWLLFMMGALYVHYFSAYVLMAMGLHALIFLRRRQRFEAIAIIVAAGLAFLPWYLAVMRQQFFSSDFCFACGSAVNWETLRSFRDSWFGQQWPLMIPLMLFGLIYWNGEEVGTRHALSLQTQSKGKPFSFLLSPFSSLTFLIAMMGLIPLAGTFLISHEFLVFFNHHLAQLTIPVVLLTALGLGNLQRPARLALVVIIVAYSVTTVDWYRQKAPWKELVAQFAPYVEPDQLVLGEIGAEEAALVYYFDHRLPSGVQISTYPWWGNLDRFTYYEQMLPNLINHQRGSQQGDVTTAWFVYWNSDTGMLHDLEAAGFVQTMTVTVDHVGNTLPAYRYDILPETSVATFDNGMTLRAVEIDPDALRIDLWWSADAPIGGAYAAGASYVTKAFLLDGDGTQVAQFDSVPFLGQRSTQTWAAGEVVYDPKTLVLEPGIDQLAPGQYTVAVQVYRFVDGGIELSLTQAGAESVNIGSIER